MIIRVPYVLAALTLLAIGNLAHSATVIWTNTSGGSWTVAANWSPNQVPTNTDIVRITTPGTYKITLNTNSTVASLVLGAGGGAAGVQTLALTNLHDSTPQSFTANPLIVTNGGGFHTHRISLGGVAIVNAGRFDSVGGVRTIFPNQFSIPMGMATTVTNGGVFNARDSDFTAIVTVASGGLLAADGIHINAAFPLTVASGGVLNLADARAGKDSLDLSGAVTNAGTINLTNATIRVRNPGGFGGELGGMITLPGGRINFQGSATIFSSTFFGEFNYPGYFINRGIVTKSTPATTTTIDIGRLDLSQGTVSNLAGTLVLKAHQITNAAGAYPLAGTYHAAASATIQFGATTDSSLFGINGSPLILGTPFVLGGSGRYQFTSGLLLLTTNTLPKLEFLGGTVQLGAGFQGGAITNFALNGTTLTNSNILPVAGTFTVTNSRVNGNFTVATGGTFGGSNVVGVGVVTVANGGVVTFDGFGGNGFKVAAGAQLNVAGTWNVSGPTTNAGTINLTTAALLVLRSPGGLVNQAGGLINFGGNGGTISSYSGPEYFINQGKVSQNSGPGTTNLILFSSFFDNSQGTVTNSSGDLLLSFPGNLVGKYGAAPGAAIKFVGGTSASPLTPGTPLTLVGDCQVSGRVVAPYGASTYFLSGGYLYLPMNVIPGLGLRGGALQLGPSFQGGAITNLTLTGIALTNTLPIAGSLTGTDGTGLAGNFVVASGGVVYANGIALYGKVTVASGGRLDVADSLFIYAPLTNAGTINLTNFGISCYTYDASSYGGLWNQPAGLINIWGNGGIGDLFGNSGLSYLVNQGQIIKHAGTTTSWMDVRFTTNFGVMTAKSGTLGLGYYAPAVLQPGSSLNVVLNNATNHGGIMFGGPAPLGGAFNVALTNGYVPAQGDSFSVVSYVSRSGSFSSLGLPPVVNWQSAYTSTNLVLTVEGITTISPLPAGTAGTAYNQTLTALGGSLPYAWSVISGGLPSGLSLSTNGVISGTPGMATNASFTARVVGGSLSATKTFSLTIQPAAPTITTASPLPSGTAGGIYSQALAASGSTTPYTWSITSGSLPAGLSLNTNGVISGTPTVTTVASFTVRVVGGNGLSTNKIFGLTIVASALPSAVDSSGLVWTTGGSAPWFAQTTNTHDAVDAAQSGLITEGQESWMQTTLTGPGTLTYWRKVSSEPGYDYLEFYLDGVLQSGRISGTVDWQKQTNSIPAGAHTVKWRYLKDPECCTEGDDAGWVDEVSYAGPSSLLQFAVTSGSPSVSNGLFTARLMGPTGTNVVVDRSFNLTTWTPWQTNPVPVGGLNLAVPMGTNRQQFFRARMP